MSQLVCYLLVYSDSINIKDIGLNTKGILLRSLIMSENRTHFVLFYSSNSIYSNFHPAKFIDQDFIMNLPQSSKFSSQKDYHFLHVEQYMHAYKALIFKDISTLDQILLSSDPKLIKELGRKVANFDDNVWDANARDIVTRGCCLKFYQNPKMWQQMKVAGKDRQFVECAPKDKRWGIGLSLKNPKCLDPSQWQGENWLGQCLDKTWNYLEEGTIPELLIKFH